jgi:hypothetical protein
MTTKPKARKFRIRRTPLSEGDGQYGEGGQTSEAKEPRAANTPREASDAAHTA